MTLFSQYEGVQFETQLKVVQISFQASTIDRITKVCRQRCCFTSLSYSNQDRAAKFVDKLSAIGGTMGLLTGFSLISAVEIIYFIVKTVKKISGK